MQIRTSQMEGVHGARCGVKRRGAELPGLSGCTPPPSSVLTNWEFSEQLDTAMTG